MATFLRPELLLWLAIYATAADAVACYTPNGDDRNTQMGVNNLEDYAPCIASATHSMCCAWGPLRANSGSADTCLSNGLCQSWDGSLIWRESCTDPTWQAPECIKLFVNGTGYGSEPIVYDGNSPTTDVKITECDNGSFCYGDGNRACCQAGEGVFINAAGVQVSSKPTSSTSSISSATSTSVTTSVTTTSATTASTGSSTSGTSSQAAGSTAGSSSDVTSNTASASDTSGLSTGAKAGIGVGVSVLALAIIAAVAFALIRRKKKRQSQANELPASLNTTYHDNTSPRPISEMQSTAHGKPYYNRIPQEMDASDTTTNSSMPKRQAASGTTTSMS